MFAFLSHYKKESFWLFQRIVLLLWRVFKFGMESWGIKIKNVLPASHSLCMHSFFLLPNLHNFLLILVFSSSFTVRACPFVSVISSGLFPFSTRPIFLYDLYFILICKIGHLPCWKMESLSALPSLEKLHHLGIGLRKKW